MLHNNLIVLKEHYPEVFRFNASVFPIKENSDVITSPYNSLLALNELRKNADCVLPIDNEALIAITSKINQYTDKTKNEQFES